MLLQNASLCIALKACEIKGSQVVSTLPAVCLVINPHLIRHTHQAEGFIILMENWNISSFWCLHIPFSGPHQGYCQVTATFKSKENETPVILEEPSFFYVIFMCFLLLFLLINSALWLQIAVALALGWAIIWCGASALQGMMTHPMRHYCSWNLGNCSVLWLMLDFGTVAIARGERPWLKVGQGSPHTGEQFLISCIFPLTLRVANFTFPK